MGLRLPPRTVLRSPLLIGVIIIILLIHFEYKHATVSDYIGTEQPLLMRLATQARPMPHIAYSDAPYGPIGLRDDIYFFPIPSADGKTLALMTWWQMHSRDVWPFHSGAEIWCRGNLDTEWSLAGLKLDTLDPQKYIIILECEARGEFASIQLRTPSSGNKSVMIPLQSIRPRKIAKGKSGPHVVAMTMLSGPEPMLPAWVEYHLLHGVDEIYIYENLYDAADVSIRAYLAPYIASGVVIMVPFHKDIFASWTGGWVQQQLLAVNHVIRSMDGYADWILLTDVDELPNFSPRVNDQHSPISMFQYGDHLDAAMLADPLIREFSLRNCFTETDEYIPPPPPIITVEGNVTVTSTPTQTQAAAPTNTAQYIGIENVGKAQLIPSEVYRFISCNDHTYRSKVFVRPTLIGIESVHHSPVGNGTDNVQDPETGMWLMHLSDHNGEIKGKQYRLDMSQVSREVTAAMLKRYKGSEILVEENLDERLEGLE